MSLRIVPMSIKDAARFVRATHRHLSAPTGGLFACGAHDGVVLRGVAIVGRPVARMLADGYTAEVVRVATDGAANACSALYGACWRAAKALGYRRLVTYTLASEPGTSLRAAGWACEGEAGGGEWARPSRARKAAAQPSTKVRWTKTTRGEP